MCWYAVAVLYRTYSIPRATGMNVKTINKKRRKATHTIAEPEVRQCAARLQSGRSGAHWQTHTSRQGCREFA